MRTSPQPLPGQIVAFATRQPPGSAISAKCLLHLGTRAAVDQALTRLVKRGELVRAGRGTYLLPVATRFGTRPPSVPEVIAAVAQQRGETVVPAGAAAANALGLTTQVPVRAVYLTSGRSRTLRVGQQEVELRHAPRWQLAAPSQSAGTALRALAWLGASHAEAALHTLQQTLPQPVLRELVALAPQMPTWLARSVVRATYG